MDRRWYVMVAGVLVLALVAGLVAPARAAQTAALPTAAAGTFETTAVTSSGAVSGFGPGNILYGFSVLSGSSGGEAGLYDTTGVATTTQGVFIDEGGAATQYNTFKSDWPSPYRLVTGLTVVVNAATAIIYHDVRS